MHFVYACILQHAFEALVLFYTCESAAAFVYVISQIDPFIHCAFKLLLQVKLEFRWL